MKLILLLAPPLLPPPERAWALKEISLVAAIAIESLSRVLPDGAYLTELSIGLI